MGVWSWHLWVDPRCKGQKDLCWALEVWADLSTKPLMSVVWVTSMDLESEWIGSWDFSGRGKLVAVSRDLTYFESGKKPRLTVVYHLSLQRGSGLWNYAMWGQALRTPLLFSAFSEYLAESGTWLNGMWQHGVLSWSHHPHTVCPGASHLHFPYMSRETRLHELFESLSVITIIFYTFVVKSVHFLPIWLSQKDSFAYVSSPPL